MNLQVNNRKFDKGALCFWSWNDDINKQEIERQLTDFSKGKFSGVVIHSRAGLRVEYMGEEWFELYRFTAKLAKSLGIEIWIYDEDGWPSGFAGGRVPELGEQYQTKRLEFSYESPQNINTLLCAWRKVGNNYKSISLKKAKKGDLFCSYTLNSSYVDLLSAKTVERFIDFTHEKYKQEMGEFFGDVIKGVFTDEPQLMKLAWSECLEKSWKERYGDNIREKLYMLFVEQGNWREFRLTFFDLVSDLLYNSFTKKISDWCEKNGLIFTGHFATEDSLLDQMITNAGVMRHYVAMGMPGIDHLGNRNTSPVLCKQVSSVANQFGKKEVLSECFGCSGWNITFDDLMWIWGRQSALGITRPCFHLAAYSIAGRRKRDYPAFFSYQEPWWEQFSTLMENINGLNATMTQGERLTDVLVISSLSTVRLNFNNDLAKYYSCQYRTLVENLLDNQLDCSLADEVILSSHGYIENDKFCVGDSKYSLVIVADSECITKSTLDLLAAFENNGGKIWYINKKPLYIDNLMTNLPKGDVIQNRKKVLEKAILHFGINRPVILKTDHGSMLKNGAIIHARKTDLGEIAHIWTDSNFSSGKTLVSFKTDNPNTGISLIDIATGEKTPLQSFYNGTEQCCYININCCDNIILELGAKADINTQKITSENRIYIGNAKVKMCEHNALNLDYAALSVEGEDFSEYKPIIEITEELYKKICNKNPKEPQDIKIKYRFVCEDALDFSSISLVAENEFVTSIMVNDSEIETKTDKWWIDRKFGEFDIASLVHSGENVIIMSYNVLPTHNEIGENEFETEKNKFFRLVEPESVYIKGDFDVSVNADVQEQGNYCSALDCNFTLSPKTEKTLGNLTRQGLWFYRGNAEYYFNIKYSGEKQVGLFFENINASCAQIIVNNKSKTVCGTQKSVRIEELLQIGDNLVTVRIIGSNRNLLGPHHHIKGVTPLVGANTFAGIKGFEDFASPEITTDSTWTDSYSFIPFGCDGFYVTYKDIE